MKTYDLDIKNSIKLTSQRISTKKVLCGYQWNIYDDSFGALDSIIFKKDGVLLETVSGVVTQLKWEYIPANHSLYISDNNTISLMFNIVEFNKSIIVLKLGESNTFAFLINNNDTLGLLKKSMFDIKSYLKKTFSLNIMNSEEESKYLSDPPSFLTNYIPESDDHSKNLFVYSLLMLLLITIVAVLLAYS